MLEIENLTKTFGTQTVISDISMTLVSGKIYGLVGRNGSGKTMLMKMILGFVSPSSGSIKIEGKVLGKDISMPDRIGAIIENPGFLPEYSGFKNLKFLAMKMCIRDRRKKYNGSNPSNFSCEHERICNTGKTARRIVQS